MATYSVVIQFVLPVTRVMNVNADTIGEAMSAAMEAWDVQYRRPREECQITVLRCLRRDSLDKWEL